MVYLKKKTFVTIIIPTYNNANYLDECLKRVIQQDYPNYEILVIDDCSTDDTEKIVKKYPVRYIKNKENSGASYTRNIGATLSKGKILVYLDSDVNIPSHAVSSIVNNLIKKHDVLMVMGTYSENTKDLNFVSDYKNLDLGFRFLQLDYKIPYLSSFFFAISKDVFKNTDGFSTSFKKSSVEDVEFGWKICNGKKLTLQDRNVKIDHRKKYTIWNLLKSNYVRVINIYKIRINSGGKYKVGNDIPLAYKVNVFLAPSIFFSAFLSLVHQEFALLTVLGLLLFSIINYKFLNYIFKKRGLVFELKCVFLMITEYIGVAVAIFSAMITTPFNKRYI
ncbi:MAG: glycosyltransferase family 2 protein [Candidatus Woesearchaeota archaeon]|jgi:glycosyltransferase involved in cell wall biosynthesis